MGAQQPTPSAAECNPRRLNGQLACVSALALERALNTCCATNCRWSPASSSEASPSSSLARPPAAASRFSSFTSAWTASLAWAVSLALSPSSVASSTTLPALLAESPVSWFTPSALAVLVLAVSSAWSPASPPPSALPTLLAESPVSPSTPSFLPVLVLPVSPAVLSLFTLAALAFLCVACASWLSFSSPFPFALAGAVAFANAFAFALALGFRPRSSPSESKLLPPDGIDGSSILQTGHSKFAWGVSNLLAYSSAHSLWVACPHNNTKWVSDPLAISQRQIAHTCTPPRARGQASARQASCGELVVSR